MTRALTNIQRRNLWLGLFAGPIVWSTYFTIGYLFLEAACRHATPHATFLGISWPSLIVVALTLIALLILGYAGRFTYYWWRQTGVPEYGRFMAQAGTLLSGFFTFVTLLTGLPALFLAPCTFVP